ncbi:1-deoxy-D-xylulose-5-phosphate reductoisomerase [Candidatus Pelagibacter sp.]|nr:1-deoxy-D-xylulose-5-phosphate reductoisomerase [Candidatus Pelagibacter sp.]
MKKIVILGSTGSIGTSLLNIIKKDKKNFKIELMSANRNYKKLIKQAIFFNVKNLIITNQDSFINAKKTINDKNINIYNNFASIKKIFKNKKIDYTMSAITGFHGLKPTLDFISFTKVIAIANKESIICGWNLIQKKLKKFNTTFIPVDSEHFSIWSLINNSDKKDIEKVYITASGGPFNKLPLKKFISITQTQALKHPNWSMGKKISIDSSTMMNKLFELIEAKKIFNIDYNQLDALIHTKSYIHSIVKFSNGLIKLLAHDTDMKIPIFNTLYSENKKKIKTKKINFEILNELNFKIVNLKKFPVMRLIKDLPNKDSLFETILVSANDTLVENFLNKKIHFLDISRILLKLLKYKEFQRYKLISPSNIDQIISLNKYVRLKTNNLCV